MNGDDLIGEIDEVGSRERDRKTIRRLQGQLAAAKDTRSVLVAAMHDAIDDSISALEAPAVPAPKKDRRSKHEEVAIGLLSDWQYGKKTTTYNSEIAGERVRKYNGKVKAIGDVQRTNHPVKHYHGFALGDMCEGELIFPGQVHEIDSSLYQQMFDAAELLAEHALDMASYFETVTMWCVPGNHGYIGGRQRRDYNPETNADRMIYRIAEKITHREARIEWHIPDRDYHLVADLGPKLKFLLRHGHQVKGWAGIPWYGWTRRVLGDASMARIWDHYDYDYQAAGHFHTPVSLYVNGRRLWINASTESHNEYAAETSIASAGEPAQWLLFGRPGFGVTAEYLVKL